MKMPSPQRKPAKVFISYSHDSPKHMNQVLALSDALRAKGIDCHIDQYEMSPPEGWPRWMMRQIEQAGFVLVVCTETYERRFKGEEAIGKGLGVTWEGAILTQELYEAQVNNTKFIPILFSSSDSTHIPIVLRSVTRYVVTNKDGYETLYRHLTNQPYVQKSELGEIQPMPSRERTQDFFSNPKSTSLWIIEFEGQYEGDGLEKAQAIIAELQKISGDSHLRLRRIEPGSVKLILEGSPEGFARIEFLFRTGQLTEVLGTEILDMQWEEARTAAEVRLPRGGIIYEVRTYTLRPGTVAEFEELYAKRLPLREKHSKLGAFWHTEVGPLNQVIHVYPYESLEQRTAVREAMAKDTALQQLPGGREFIVAQEAEIVVPAPFMHPLGSRDYGTGNMYEMRIDTFASGDIPKVLDSWGRAIEAREKFSPLAACWTNELGGLNKFVHVWVYKNLNERSRIHDETRKAGAWPPQTGVRPIRQENKILVAAPFSPVR
jgi:hypothetical protein